MNQAIFDWTRIDKNPVSPAVRAALYSALLQRRAGRVFDIYSFIRDFVGGHAVLDIGMVEHDLTHIRSDEWLHRQICLWARYTLGIDILAEELAMLRQEGFNVAVADATSDADLGQRFDRVFMGEVIEHVDKPLALLKFAARHLGPGGLILATTPNPLYFREILSNVRNNLSLPNAEHVSWVTPSLALELGRRAGLDLSQYWLAQGRSTAMLKRPLHLLRDLIAGRNSELFTGQFLYIWRIPD